MKPEDLVIGEKYIHPNSTYNPYVYLGNKHNYLSFNAKRSPFMFLDKAGDVIDFDLIGIEPFIKHAEPVEIFREGWVLYKVGVQPLSNTLDTLTNLYTDGLFYRNENEAVKSLGNVQEWKIKKVKITANY